VVASAARKQRRRKKKARCRPAKRRHRARHSSYQPPEIRARESRRRRRRSCRRRRRHKHHHLIPPAPKPAPPTPIPPAPAAPKKPPVVASPIPVYSGSFGAPQAERLLWRAGFGPSPGHAQSLAQMGLKAAVQSLTRPTGAATLTGPAPTDSDGSPLSPEDIWGHDHLWWLDRMVRTDQPLVERMALIWHDWFATSNDGVGSSKQMLDQNALFRRSFLGSFQQLVLDVTADPAMILWLNQNENTRWNPNENYGRELQELFTLGADRGAYTEEDVREIARALTGWRNDWSAEQGNHNFRFDPAWHDPDNKTIYGQTGAFDWRDACRLVVQHAKHPSFFVSKLWSYFIPVPPTASEQTALEKVYKSGGYSVRPVAEAILMHPQLYQGPRMVKPPVVFLAGLLRALRRPMDTNAWVWLCEGAGQKLFWPPDVSGWNDSRWLDTSTIRGRWDIVYYAISDRYIGGDDLSTYDSTETPEQAVTKAINFWNVPPSHRRERPLAHRLRP
jgi:uncharacterized protein DUF1800